MNSMSYLDYHKKNGLFSEDEEEFNFKYVPVEDFKRIVKNVKRNRFKEVVKKECIALATQQIDQQTGLYTDCDNDRTENQVKNSKISEKISSRNETATKAGKNALLTIPEENRISPTLDSLKLKSLCRNSKLVDLEMAGESCYKFLRKITRNNPRDSSKDFNPTEKSKRDVEKRFNEIFMQPDLNTTYQVLMIQRKMSDILDEISYRLDNIPLPDGESDMERRQQRVIEFSIRFSRNYLYDLGRQITDIHRHLNVVLENEGIRFSKRGLLFHRQTVEHKLVSVHQLMLNALNAYCKHVPSSTLKGQSGKLKEVLEMVIELLNICKKINLTPEYMGFRDGDELFLGKDTEDKCAAIFEKIKSKSDRDMQLLNHTANSITAALNMKKRNQKRQVGSITKCNKNLQSNRKRIRKTGSIFQKVKKQQSHNSEVNTNKETNEEIYSGALTNLAAFRLLKDAKNPTVTSKIQVPLKEDDIKTMMDMIETDTDDESNKESLNPITGIVIKETSDVLMKKLKDKTKSSRMKRKAQTILNNDLLNETLVNTNLAEIADDKKKELANQQICSANNRTDSQNMKLIVVKDDKLEKEEDLKDVSCQVSCIEDVKKSNEIEFALIIDEEAKKNLLDYKQSYQSYLQSKPMYFNNTHNKPWEIVSWVADKLVDELIIDVSKEFQIDNIIKRMFELEFQEF